MHHYRLSFLDTRTGTMVAFVEFNERDDIAAIKASSRHTFFTPADLWRDGARVASFARTDTPGLALPAA